MQIVPVNITLKRCTTSSQSVIGHIENSRILQSVFWSGLKDGTLTLDVTKAQLETGESNFEIRNNEICSADSYSYCYIGPIETTLTTTDHNLWEIMFYLDPEHIYHIPFYIDGDDIRIASRKISSICGCSVSFNLEVSSKRKIYYKHIQTDPYIIDL